MGARYGRRRLLSPFPHVREVPREAAGDDEDGVDPQIIAIAHEAWSKPFRGSCDAPQPVLIKREIGSLGRGTGLHFNESEGSPAPSDQIDFAAGHACPLRENTPSVETEPKGREPLCAPPTRFRLLPVHSDASSKARA
jgi:hypothetical protein